MTLNITERKLETIVKKSVEEAIISQFSKLNSVLIPEVSTKEQKEIEKLYGRPSKKSARKSNFNL